MTLVDENLTDSTIPSFTTDITTLTTDHPGASQLSEDCRNVLSNYQPLLSTIRSYSWFSQANEDYARIALQGALASATHDHPDLLPFPLTGLIDLYHEDRALHVSHLLNTGQPLLLQKIPHVPPGVSKQNASLYERSIKPLRNWQSATPFSILPNITTVLTQEIPDQMVLVKFRKAKIKVKDPLIYAVYGPYYVKIAEWD